MFIIKNIFFHSFIFLCAAFLIKCANLNYENAVPNSEDDYVAVDKNLEQKVRF